MDNVKNRFYILRNKKTVLKIDVDQRLLPIVGEFKPATWRKDIK